MSNIKCYIITAHIEGNPRDLITPSANDFVICADGGYEIAREAGITPGLVIGDSDSGKMQPSPDSKTEVIRFPATKDVSDTFLCVKHAVDLGYEDITIIGGIGGRLDHTMSNIQTLSHFSGLVQKLVMVDGKNFVTVIENTSITIPHSDNSCISLFSLSDKCEGVTVEGLLYPLKNADLNNSYPVGLSNEFTGGDTVIDVKSGKLLIIMSSV